ncbi:MAG: tRNA (cytidine(34)-2'-O)-methyltransferase [Planctomycetota bacterium]|nr:tRNA (cytidine(34)-2'-O)-methyltransferase [Planctomycetota bacterium]
MTDPSLNLVLYTPPIPNNTGNSGRTARALGARLHLVHPLGFDLSEKACRRAGLDYWRHLDVVEHRSWEAYLDSVGSARIWLFSTRAGRSFRSADYARGDHLLFGPEDRGLPPELHESIESRHGDQARLRIPMSDRPEARSLNLATAVAIASYEALREIEGGF